MKDRSPYVPHHHFAPVYGWTNDPNGLVYHDGQYELYYQHNPKGVQWDNMSWGHAYTRDFLHWVDMPLAMEPDEMGMIFSGCAVMNRQGLLGLPTDAIIYYYTAAGGTTPESRGRQFEIVWAYSTDGGRTIVKTKQKVLDSPGKDNRDPAVFYHEPSKAWILVIWLADNDFGIYRSADMQHFTLSQRLTLPGGFECPDLYCLPVLNRQGQPAGQSRWVFWNADNSYFVGSFDGYRFTQEQPKQYAFVGEKQSIAYAAQTWSDDPEGRRIVMAWLKTKTICDQTTGSMSFPRVLSLVETPEDPQDPGNGRTVCRLKMDLPHEIEEAWQSAGELSAQNPELSVPDTTVETSFPCGKDLSLTYYDKDGDELLNVRVTASQEKLQIRYADGEETVPLSSFSSGKPAGPVSLIYDRGIMELSWDGGLKVFYADAPKARTARLSGIQLKTKDSSVRIPVRTLE